MSHILCRVKAITIGQLRRDFDTVLACVAAGVEGTALNRARFVPRIRPPRAPEAPPKFKMPHFDPRQRTPGTHAGMAAKHWERYPRD